MIFRNKTRAIEDINISIALADFRVNPLSVQCKLNDIAASAVPLFGFNADYTMPCAIMAFATLRKPATFAPVTKSSSFLPYSFAAAEIFA